MASSPALCCLSALTCPFSSNSNYPFPSFVFLAVLSSFAEVNLQDKSDYATTLSKSSVTCIEGRYIMASEAQT